MDMPVTRIGAVIVAELRTAGNMNSTIGHQEKKIKALTELIKERGGVYTPMPS